MPLLVMLISLLVLHEYHDLPLRCCMLLPLLLQRAAAVAVVRLPGTTTADVGSVVRPSSL